MMSSIKQKHILRSTCFVAAISFLSALDSYTISAASSRVCVPIASCCPSPPCIDAKGQAQSPRPLNSALLVDPNTCFHSLNPLGLAADPSFHQFSTKRANAAALVLEWELRRLPTALHLLAVAFRDPPEHWGLLESIANQQDDISMQKKKKSQTQDLLVFLANLNVV